MKSYSDGIFKKFRHQWMQFLATLTVSLTLFTYGLHYGWTGAYLNEYLANADESIGSNGAWLSSMLFIGGAFGGPVIVFILQKLGRKMVIHILSIPFIISWSLIAINQSYLVLCISRFIAGFAAGASFTVVPIYIGEIAEPEIRGQLSTIFTMEWNLGMFTSFCFGSFMSITTMAMVSTTIPIILIIILFFIPESPYFYMAKNQIEKAENALRALRSREDVSEEILIIQQTLEEDAKNQGRIRDMFLVPSNRYALIIALALTAFQELSGRSAFIFYCEIIFAQAGGPTFARFASIAYCGMQIFVTCCTSFAVDRWGRRPLLIASTVGVIFAHIIEGTYFTLLDYGYQVQDYSFISLVGLLLYVAVFTLGLGVVPMILAGELFSSQVKEKCTCAIDLTAASTSFFVAHFFQLTKDNLGEGVPFWGFMCTSIVGLLFIQFYVPETKGKTLKDIQTELRLENEKHLPDLS